MRRHTTLQFDHWEANSMSQFSVDTINEDKTFCKDSRLFATAASTPATLFGLGLTPKYQKFASFDVVSKTL